jgi:UDP-N-acetylglucosamine 4-epimerase
MEQFPRVRECRARYGKFGEGDVRHSQADISKARRFLAYAPMHRVGEGLKEAIGWYVRNFSRQS